jgi:hypothetical protein
MMANGTIFLNLMEIDSICLAKDGEEIRQGKNKQVHINRGI